MQTKFSFDRTSLKKIGKGALIAVGSVLAAFLASNINEINEAIHASPILAGLITAAAGVAINIIKEWISGAARQTVEEMPAEISPEMKEIVLDIKEQAVEESKQ